MKGKESHMEKNRCIVIGAGDFTISALSDYNEQTDLIIAVDGGLLYCGLLNLEPDIIIGDFDSVDEELMEAIRIIEEQYPEKILRLKPEKDDTDMLVALKWGLAKGIRSFQIYGGTGGRLDHTLANIQCLLYLKHQHAEGFLFDEDGCILIAEAGATEEVKNFQPSMEGFLSLFSLERKSVVSIKNMKYPLDRYTVTNDYPIGISNEFIPGNGGSVTVHSGAVVILLKWPS